jgi:hypothetical protein
VVKADTSRKALLVQLPIAPVTHTLTV